MPTGDGDDSSGAPRLPRELECRLTSRYPGLREQDLLYLAELRQRFLCYADDQFDTELVDHLQARFWEMYLACVLLDCRHDIVPRHERPAEGPDLCVRGQGRRIWIEAIAPTVGNGADAVPVITPDKEVAGEVCHMPNEEIILRYASAFTEKRRKFEKYRSRGIVGDDDAVIIAINGGRIPHVYSEPPLPRIVCAMYAYGTDVVTLNRETLEVVEEGHTYRVSLPKRSGSGVPTDSLLNSDAAFASAVVFSYANPWNHPAEPGDDFVVCHHCDPSVPLDRRWFGRGREYWVDRGSLHWRSSER